MIPFRLYCVRLLRRQRQQEGLNEKADELNVEQRFDKLASKAIDRIEESAESVDEATDDLRDLHARAGTYPIVNFRLLMRQHSPPEAFVDEQFEWAATKLRQPLSEHDPLDLDTDQDQNLEDQDEESDKDQGDKTVDDLI